MATVRIYKVAELLNTSSQEVIALLKRDHGIEVKSASSTIEEVVARQFVERLARQRNITVPSNASFADTPMPAKGKKPAGKAPEPVKAAPSLPPPRLVKSAKVATPAAVEPPAAAPPAEDEHVFIPAPASPAPFVPEPVPPPAAVAHVEPEPVIVEEPPVAVIEPPPVEAPAAPARVVEQPAAAAIAPPAPTVVEEPPAPQAPAATVERPAPVAPVRPPPPARPLGPPATGRVVPPTLRLRVEDPPNRPGAAGATAPADPRSSARAATTRSRDRQSEPARRGCASSGVPARAPGRVRRRASVLRVVCRRGRRWVVRVRSRPSRSVRRRHSVPAVRLAIVHPCRAHQGRDRGLQAAAIIRRGRRCRRLRPHHHRSLARLRSLKA